MAPVPEFGVTGYTPELLLPSMGRTWDGRLWCWDGLCVSMKGG